MIHGQKSEIELLELVTKWQLNFVKAEQCYHHPYYVFQRDTPANFSWWYVNLAANSGQCGIGVW